MAHEWGKGLMVYDWPECGPGRMDVEDLYQLFKARMMKELCVKRPVDPNFVEILPLRDADNG